MAIDRSLRTLTALGTAASSRVLNLAAIAQAQGDNDEHRKRPLFASPVLNRSIILKHRLRADEIEAFAPLRAIATKVIIPFEKKDMRVGGRSFFVGERNYAAVLRDIGNYGDSVQMNRDMEVLRLIDGIPSLDPFMLREHLRENDVIADNSYFTMSVSDQQGMFDFAAREVRRLTTLALGGGRGDAGASSGRMVEALLSGEANDRLEPLRLTFSLDHGDFAKGVFSWRGFLYYKWSLDSVWPDLVAVLREIRTVRPFNRTTLEETVFLDKAKRSLILAAKDIVQNVRRVLGIYDTAYSEMIDRKDPKLFRSFLLESPSLFREMGERLGAMAHILSFWRYRFPTATPADTPRTIDIEELMTIFQDFAQSLGTEVETSERRPVGVKPEVLSVA